MAEPHYTVQKAQESCCRCGDGFGEGDAYVSVLKEDGENTFIRKDYCRRCWNRCGETYFSFWRSRRRPDDGEVRVEEDALLPFYRDLCGKEGRKALELKYVLSLYMARKKILHLVDVEESDGRETLVFEGPEKGEKTEVENPGLSEDRIGELTRDVYALFRDAT